MSDCRCENPTDCRFHAQNGNGRGFAICRGKALMLDGSSMPEVMRQQYIAEWENRLFHPLPGSVVLDQGGVGTELAGLLSWLPEADKQDVDNGICSTCNGRVSQMNRLGPAWCEDNIDEIVSWLKDSHGRWSVWKQIVIPFVPSVVREIVHTAIRRARKKVAQLPLPFSLRGTRHLLYHVGALAKNETWRRNVEQLLNRIALFNGRRIVGIATGDGLVEPDEVKAAFRGEVNEFLISHNNPDLREVVNFIPLLSGVQQYQDDITFYAHTKGVTYPDEASVHRWTKIMYETCLDYFPRVFKLLQYYPVVGSFKNVGQAFTGSLMAWYYAGAFFWFRNRDVFTRDWRTVEQCMWGTESWPGSLFRPDEAGCIFHASTVGRMRPFDSVYLEQTVAPAFDRWRENYRDELFNTELAGHIH